MILAATNAAAPDISERTKWYVIVRMFFLLGVGIPGILTQYVFDGWTSEVQKDSLLLMGALLSNAAFYILSLLRSDEAYHKKLAFVWLILDVALISLLIFTKGGVESRSPILYTIPILMSSAIFGRFAAFITAAFCSLTYTVMLALDYAGIVTSFGALDPTLRTNLPYVINSIFFFSAILLVIALAINFITRLLIEKEHQASENMRSLLRAQEIAKLGSWEWDVGSDTISWSKELHTIFGLQPDGSNISYNQYVQLIHPDDRKHVGKTIQAAIKTKQPFHMDHRILLPDGTVKYIHGEGQPYVDRLGGKVIKLAGTAQDISEAYRLNDARKEFLSLASHQLRTPASGVKSYLSLLLDGAAGEVSRKQKDFLKKAYDSNNHQLAIIDKLLSLANVESGKLTIRKERVDLNFLVSSILKYHANEAKRKKLRLRFKRSPQILMVYADPSYLTMVIDNLVSNAIKYTPANGRVTIATDSSKTLAYLEVTDETQGIADDDLPRLFKKYSRLESTTAGPIGGSGLGLYLAKYIIDLHRGSLSVTSKVGSGTSFNVKLPLSSSAAKRAV